MPYDLGYFDDETCRLEPIHPPADSDGSGAGDGQHGPQRYVAAVIGFSRT